MMDKVVATSKPQRLSSIKQLRARRSSRYDQGYVNTRSCTKLIDPTQPVIYRSSYEKKFITWLESSPRVVRWGSECMVIPYMFIDEKTHRYYPDFYMEMTNGDRVVVEIKPSSQTRPPVGPTPSAYAIKEWQKNTCKWRAARKFCEDRGMKFMIITENTINRLR